MIKNYHFKGFTLIELIIVIATIGVLAAITVVGYNSFQEKAANNAVLSTLRDGSDALEVKFARNRDYPPNLAGTEFSPTDNVLTVLYTNAPFTRIHSNLTPEQGAQLLLNVCNASMPIKDGSTTYNTSCTFAGKNFHIKGQRTSNIIIHGPTFNKSDFDLTCGPVCEEAEAKIIAQYEAQGGTWPVTVPKRQIPLPEPDTTLVTDNATKYCLEARYDRYPSVTVKHIKSGQTVPNDGPCPEDPDLHYIEGGDGPGSGFSMI